MSSLAPESGAPRSRGVLFVVSAPSGTGKTTVVERLVERMPDLALSRSYTSRPAREGERDGVDYHFVSRGRFEAMIAAGEFLEWADVFGNLYGTCAAATEAVLNEGRDVVLIYPPAEKTANMTLAEVHRCKTEGLHVSSFALIEDYFYLGLVNFVEQMARVSGGVAAYCNAGDLGNMVIDSFVAGRRTRRTL